MRRWLAVCVGLGLLWLVYQPLLRGWASALVVDETWDRADYVFAWGDERTLPLAAEWYRQGRATGILLNVRAPQRVERLGILPPLHERQIAVLVKLGVPPAAIELVPGDSRSDAQVAGDLDRWLTAHPGVRVQAIVPTFQTRRMLEVFNRHFTPEKQSQLRVCGAADPELDRDHWWLARHGFKAIGNATFCTLIDWIVPELPPPSIVWDPDAYERSLR